jgi:predicted Zn-dependent peptidase
VAHDQFARALWGEHALALPVLGTKESITGMGREVIDSYWGRRYRPPAVVLAAAGHVEHERVVELAERHFGDWEGAPVGHELREPAVVPRVEVRTKETEQAHLVFGGEALTRRDERRFAFGLLNHVLGAGMSSRLFREIREERGLAYAVYSFRMPYADSGAYGIYVGTTPHQVAQVLELIREGLAGLSADGVTADELERAKGNLKGSLALSMEETNSRMIRLGRHELTEVRHLSLDETVAAIEGVTLAEVHEVAQEVFSSPRVLGAVGPFRVPELEAFVR